MLINYVPGEESRIAIVRDGRLEEFYQERASAESHVGNIYKGKIVNVEPSIQAAFIDFGLERNGFLHITDVHPMHFRGKDREEFEKVGNKTPHRERPPIQKCFRRGDSVLVQVLKEGIGTKGPTLTSYLSIPGRFLVMMPNMKRMGVSRKVEDDDARRQMRDILQELKPPDEFGFIVRTAGIGQTKTELKRDLAYLQRLWKNIERRRKQLKGPGEMYTESDLVIRTIRDVFSNEIDRVVVDDATAARRAHEFLAIASPRSRSKVFYYDDPVPLFHRFDVEQQIESIHSREVLLPSGGSLVIDPTEALVAIDVNSGKSREARDAETNAYKTNCEAVDEIARQLRLRDLGGVVVNDLIDMQNRKHRQQIETRIRNHLKRDRARTRIGAISQFGLLEMTRQRMRPSLKKSIYTHCEACVGTGHVKTAESVVLDVMRRLALAMHHQQVTRVELTISPDVAFHLLNRKRESVVDLERAFGKQVMVRVGGATVDHVHISAFDDGGSVVEPESVGGAAPQPPEAFVEVTGQPIQVDLEQNEPPPLSPAESSAWAGNEQAQPTDQTGQDRARDEGEGNQANPNGGRRRKRRRGGRRRRKKKSEDQGEKADEITFHADNHDAFSGSGDDASSSASAEPAAKGGQAFSSSDQADASTSAGGQSQGRGRRKRRRRGGRGRKRGGKNSENTASDNRQQTADQDKASDDGSTESKPGGKPTSHPEPASSATGAAPTGVSSGYSNRMTGSNKQ